MFKLMLLDGGKVIFKPWVSDDTVPTSERPNVVYMKHVFEQFTSHAGLCWTRISPVNTKTVLCSHLAATFIVPQDIQLAPPIQT
eukprot:5604928-Amphidinium_carterae.1